jgi:hypothetical protein
MTRGIVLFAHNNEVTDYYQMAVATAKRIHRFLDLPVTIITDEETIASTKASVESVFDKTILIEPDKDNQINKKKWYNKGRYQIYDLTPYDDTIVLDTDYMVNSTALLRVFEQPGDIQCYRDSKYMFGLEMETEQISPVSFGCYWATVIRFKKTPKVADVFEMLKRVQHNYDYYAELHQFLGVTYRNDYALTFAMRTINGHIENPQDFITGSLIHIGKLVKVTRVDDTTYDLQATRKNSSGKEKTHRIRVKDFDFHMLNKENFMELVENE